MMLGGKRDAVSDVVDDAAFICVDFDLGDSHLWVHGMSLPSGLVFSLSEFNEGAPSATRPCSN